MALFSAPCYLITFLDDFGPDSGSAWTAKKRRFALQGLQKSFFAPRRDLVNFGSLWEVLLGPKRGPRSQLYSLWGPVGPNWGHNWSSLLGGGLPLPAVVISGGVAGLQI